MRERNDNSTSCKFIIWLLVLASVCVAALLAVLVYAMVVGNIMLTAIVSVSLAVMTIACVVCCAVAVCRKQANENAKDSDCNSLLVEAYREIMKPEKSSNE